MSSWYGPDKSRDTWCVLDIAAETEGSPPYVSGWGIGDGNIEELLQVHHELIDSQKQEDGLLESLGEALDDRRYDERLLVTRSSEVFRILRARLLTVDGGFQPTLRGFTYVAVEDLIDRYLATDMLSRNVPPLEIQPGGNSEIQFQNRITRLWQWFTELVPAIPIEAVTGRAL